MPIYAYRCATCGHAQDLLQKMSDPVLTVCPACGAATYVKQVTAAGFQLKGSGWYVTDFREGSKAPKPDGADASGDKAGKSDKADANSTAGEGAAAAGDGSKKTEAPAAAPSPAPAAAPVAAATSPKPAPSGKSGKSGS